MRSWSKFSGQLTDKRNLRQSNAAFSLIELMVVVTILSLLFLIAVPTYQRLQRKARTAAIVTDFRVYATAFQAHAHDTGTWPPESPAGVVPTGMTPEELKFDDWVHITPMGGKFDWENNQVHPGGTSPGGRWRAAITISPTSDAPIVNDAALLLDIDRAIDDGDLNAGSFRLGFGGNPLFVIEN